ncbi:hypothetical protein [Mesorhizobium sp. M0816]|uniref:hypothetical protein n=2 Tax=Mesorhizobium TaxID=68287 RepID=UPI0033369642
MVIMIGHLHRVNKRGSYILLGSPRNSGYTAARGNEVDRLTMPERAGLLRRAAATIKSYCDDIGYSGTPANDTGSDDVVFDLESIGSIVEIFPALKSGDRPALTHSCPTVCAQAIALIG